MLQRVLRCWVSGAVSRVLVSGDCELAIARGVGAVVECGEMSVFRHVFCGAVLLLFPAAVVWAGYEDDTGLTSLAARLGSSLPTGSGISVSMVESGTAYLPQAGSGTFAGSGVFSGKSFTAKSGASGLSLHAERVAYHFFGPYTGSGSGWATMSPDIGLVDVYESSSFMDNGFLRPGATNTAPLTELRSLQSHSWILYADAAKASLYNDLLRRLDFAINRDGFLCLAGVNNGAAEKTPELLASAYNALAVGLSNGNHSRGGTSAFVDGPGRLKPEITVPIDATSWATPYTASAAALLRQRSAATGSPQASRPQLLKAILLTGATKDEFPFWSKSAQTPLDAITGAGELNIDLSDAIMAGGEQLPNLAGPLPAMAWDFHLLSAGQTADYLLRVPAGETGTELSAFVVWHRTLTDPAGGGFSLTPDPLVDFNLSLDLLPSAGGDAVSVDASTSTLYNLEHVWKRSLPAGTYRLRVSRGSGTAREFAIAWRLSTVSHVPDLSAFRGGDVIQLTATGLLPGQAYRLEWSADLAAWSVHSSFTAAAATFTWPLPVTEVRRFYRLVVVPL